LKTNRMSCRRCLRSSCKRKTSYGDHCFQGLGLHAGIRVLLSAGIAHVGPDRQEEILKTNFAGGLLISIFRLFKANLKFMKCPTCHETLLLSDKNGQSYRNGEK